MVSATSLATLLLRRSGHCEVGGGRRQLDIAGGRHADLDGVVPRRAGRGDGTGTDLRVFIDLVHVAAFTHAAALAGVGIHHVGAEDVIGGGAVGVESQVGESHRDRDFRVFRDAGFENEIEEVCDLFFRSDDCPSIEVVAQKTHDIFKRTAAKYTEEEVRRRTPLEPTLCPRCHPTGYRQGP